MSASNSHVTVGAVDEGVLVYVVSPMHHGIKPDGEPWINLYGWIKTPIKGRKVIAEGDIILKVRRG